MNRRPVAKTSWFSVALVIAAVTLWALDQKRAADTPQKTGTSSFGKHAPEPAPRKPWQRETAGPYEVYHQCSLVKARNNDGDSFVLRLPDGRTAEFRLYFVDTPESAFKSYAGGHTNHERIRQQAADLGGITPDQAVAIGRKGKAFTLGLLGSGPFTIFTRWDSPFHDDRFHAFVRVTDERKARWLHELLIERGLARIKTKAADLPDGSAASRQSNKLRELEQAAKRNNAGAWAL